MGRARRLQQHDSRRYAAMERHMRGYCKTHAAPLEKMSVAEPMAKIGVGGGREGCRMCWRY